VPKRYRRYTATVVASQRTRSNIATKSERTSSLLSSRLLLAPTGTRTNRVLRGELYGTDIEQAHLSSSFPAVFLNDLQRNKEEF
jgi:hypothetical protein